MGAATTQTVLAFCLLLGFKPVSASEPDSMAAFLGKQSFYPSSWAVFTSSAKEDVYNNATKSPAALVSVHTPSWAPSLAAFWTGFARPSAHRASMAAVYQSVSASHPASLAAFLSSRDPASDLVNELVAKTGLDDDEEVRKPDSSRSSPVMQTDPDRFSVRSIDLAATPTQKGQPSADETPEASASSWKASVSHRASAGMQSLYKDMDTDIDKSPAEQWGEFGESDAAELSRLSKMTVKAPVPEHANFRKLDVAPRGLNRLGKTVQKYSEDESKEVMQAPSLPAVYLHHGKVRGTHAEQQVAHLKVHPDDISTVAPPAKSSMVKSKLAAETNSSQAAKVAKDSAMSSVHRSSRAGKLQFKVQPEDIHYEVKEPTAGNTVNASTASKSPAKPLAEPRTPSIKVISDWEQQFNANAVGGHLDGSGVEKVLSKLTSMKDPSSWNWKMFDIDGDHQLSHREFMNAKQVLQRFQSKK